jgi:hypothetical protein
LSDAIREHGVLRIYYGLKEEMVGLSLKGGIRWMVKPAFDGAPHAHLLPCHSFSHTNLKSPCAEQGFAWLFSVCVEQGSVRLYNAK